MPVTIVRVRVHRRGPNPDRDARMETATKDSNNRLYVRHGGRWWQLSKGTSGWHSLNVGMPLEFTPK